MARYIIEKNKWNSKHKYVIVFKSYQISNHTHRVAAYQKIFLFCEEAYSNVLNRKSVSDTGHMNRTFSVFFYLVGWLVGWILFCCVLFSDFLGVKSLSCFVSRKQVLFHRAALLVTLPFLEVTPSFCPRRGRVGPRNPVRSRPDGGWGGWGSYPFSRVFVDWMEFI